MKQRWTKEQIWEWYDARPWMRGCNYMSADCANRIDQWQALGFEERLKTTDEELALAAETGFNTIRIILEYVVWKEEHDGFLERFDRYLDVCAKHGITCMVVLANDCMPPKTELWKLPYIGEQHYDWGYHGGKKHSQHGAHNGPAPHFYLDDPETAADYYKMVSEIVTLYKDDPRICVWDVYNEPGNSRRDGISLPNVQKMFETVRAADPSQPITAGVWRTLPEDGFNAIEQYILNNSDIISYHCYSPFPEHVQMVRLLKQFGRPLMNTEWMGRCLHNDVFDNFPMFYLEKIACYNWGFVAGKYQTYEPWEATWNAIEADPNADFDVKQWFHDLYRPNHRPYDPKEIALIKKMCKAADDEFARGQAQKAK